MELHGQEAEDYLRTLADNAPIIDLTEFEDRDDFEASVAGAGEGLADLEAKDTISFEEMFASLREHRVIRRKEKEVQNQWQ